MNQIEAKWIEQGTNQGGNGQSTDRLPTDLLTWDGAERRRHPRIRVKWNGILECPNSRMKTQVRLSDVSEGGCCVRMDRLPPGSHRFGEQGLQERLELTLFLGGAMSRIVVEVRWYIPVCEGVYGAGLEFISMTRGTRLLLQTALQKLGI
ncbi:MAG: PilZ domain-containing protein [Deltaproteobacteria bacterium]|nr:PilZ domain-containing protein [Syntrophobacteraceae bacterium]NTV58016.1 PilZ domain-containing protein [Deltaproteobacteria bacterium]